jgi:mRNA interferase HigB
MDVVGIGRIYKFIQKHSDSKSWLEAWLAEVRAKDWQSPNDIKKKYMSASILEDNKVIFNVKGNKYRMEVQVTFKTKVIVIKRLGTHSEYDRWAL